MFGRPDVAWCGFGEEVSPVRGLGPRYGFKVGEFGLSRHEDGVGSLMFVGCEGGLRELWTEGGKERGPPRLGPREGRARGAVASIVVMRGLRPEENQWSTWLWEGVSGGGASAKCKNRLWSTKGGYGPPGPPGPPWSTLIHILGKISKSVDRSGSEWTRWAAGTKTLLGGHGAFRITLGHAQTFL